MKKFFGIIGRGSVVLIINLVLLYWAGFGHARMIDPIVFEPFRIDPLYGVLVFVYCGWIYLFVFGCYIYGPFLISLLFWNDVKNGYGNTWDKLTECE